MIYRYLATLCLMAAMAGAALAQGNSNDLDLFKKIDLMPGAEKTPAPTGDKKDAAPKEPTVITASTESSFDGKLKMAIFVGDVHITDPQFTLSAKKLTVYFKKDAEAKPNASGSPKPNGSAKPAGPAKPAEAVKPGVTPASSPAAGSGTGGLERAIAEGDVVIESDKADPNGGQPTHYVGKGAKVDYNAINGEAILYGWPQVQQGINTIVSTEESTVIHLFRDRNMKVYGAHRIVVNDPGPGKSPDAK